MQDFKTHEECLKNNWDSLRLFEIIWEILRDLRDYDCKKSKRSSIQQVYVGFCVLCVPCKSLERNLVNESLRDIERY